MFDWVTEWWSVFVWIGLYLVTAGIACGIWPFVPNAEGFPWQERGDDKVPAWCFVFLWPLVLLIATVYMMVVPTGKFLGTRTHRLILAIKRWWDRFARWRDCRKNSKIVKGKNDGIPKAVANPRNP